MVSDLQAPPPPPCTATGATAAASSVAAVMIRPKDWSSHGETFGLGFAVLNCCWMPFVASTSRARLRLASKAASTIDVSIRDTELFSIAFYYLSLL